MASDAAFFESCAELTLDVVPLVELASPPPIFDEMPELLGKGGGG